MGGAWKRGYLFASSGRSEQRNGLVTASDCEQLDFPETEASRQPQNMAERGDYAFTNEQ